MGLRDLELLISKSSHILQALLPSKMFIPILQMEKERLRAVPRPHSETGQSWTGNTWSWHFTTSCHFINHCVCITSTSSVPGPVLGSRATIPPAHSMGSKCCISDPHPARSLASDLQPIEAPSQPGFQCSS